MQVEYNTEDLAITTIDKCGNYQSVEECNAVSPLILSTLTLFRNPIAYKIAYYDNKSDRYEFKPAFFLLNYSYNSMTTSKALNQIIQLFSRNYGTRKVQSVRLGKKPIVNYLGNFSLSLYRNNMIDLKTGQIYASMDWFKDQIISNGSSSDFWEKRELEGVFNIEC